MGWLWRKQRERELERELRADLELESEEQQERGLSPEEARYAARRAFGNTALVKEDVREMWGWVFLDRLKQDVIYALRGMRRSPGFAATAVLSLALGIGANTAIFTLIDALLLRWLPVHEPQRLLQLRIHPGGKRDTPLDSGASFSYPVVRALAEQREIFAGLCGFSGASFVVGPPGAVRRTQGAWVTGAYYETLGLVPVAGRLLAAEDDQPGAPPVAVITDAYWQTNFGRDPRIVGSTVPVHGVPVTIVGVSPSGFTGAQVGAVANLTIPVSAMALLSPEMAGLLGPGNSWLRVLARPRAGVSPAQAGARLAAVWPQLWEPIVSPQWPAWRRNATRDATFDAVPGATGWTFLRAQFQKPLLVLMALVSLVLLIACANIANLLLARSSARQREIAIRLAVGAGRGRIIRQLLTESILLSFLGAAAGIGLAWLGSRYLAGLISRGPFREITFDLAPNWHVLLFTTTVAVATGILCGLAPAFRATAGCGALSRAQYLRRRVSPLITVQVALSLVLLIGAGLFIRTLQNFQRLDPGFRAEGVALVDVEGRTAGYRDAGLIAFYKQLLDEAGHLPGVVSASLSRTTPLGGLTWSEPVALKGQALPQNDNALFTSITPRYFDTMGMTLLSGRAFSTRDDAGAPTVGIVTEAFVRRFFPDGDPLGRHIWASQTGYLADIEIVGVARDAVANSLRAAPFPKVYVPYFQMDRHDATTLEVRAAGSLPQVAEDLRKLVQAKFPGTPIEVRTFRSQVESRLVQERLMATLAGGFGAVALVLAAVGLYGVLAYAVARRAKEIGIRMALGALRGEVLWMVIRQALILLGAGIAIGIPIAFGASRFVSSMLFGVEATDQWTIGAASAVLVAAALAAALLPAWRASRVDPMVALRYE